MCPICKRDGVLTLHHIKKRIIFGENDEVGIVCPRCHHEIDQLVKVFENEILRTFEFCYKQIWTSYIRRGRISNWQIRSMVRNRFLKINVNSFAVRHEYGTNDQKINYSIRRDNEFLSVSKGRKKYRNLTRTQFNVLKAGKCLVCGEYKDLTMHHIRRRAVFGESNDIGLPCRECHDSIERSVGFMEAEILKKFEYCYEKIWESYLLKGYASKARVKRLAKRQLLRVKDDLLGVSKGQEKRINRARVLEGTEKSLVLSKSQMKKIGVFT